MDFKCEAIAKRLLTDHGIQWEMKDGKIIVESVGTRDGEVITNRIECPATIDALYTWLGY